MSSIPGLPRGDARRTAFMIGGLGVLVLVVAAIAVSRRSGVDVAAPGPPRPVGPRRGAQAEEPSDPVRTEAEAKMNAAAAVWRAYGNLPAAQRVKESWVDALSESRTYGATLKSPYDRIFEEANNAVARKHMAFLINPESVATGDAFTTLIPSPDRTRCVLWGSMWSRDTDSMHQIGFRKVWCAPSKYTSKLTGKEVEEPAKEWIID